MLFNSYEFILLFLPLTLLVFLRIGALGHHRAAMAWLVGASLFFYAWWNPAYLGLILASILFNYGLGVPLAESHRTERSKRGLLLFGIAANLALLGYYKYANFFVDNLNRVAGTDFALGEILLPLAISFFTFQQITYLIDAYRGETREYSFLHYCLFVTFFPQLIAGPIVHHKEMMPQFARESIYRLSHSDLAVGITIFVLGLFKKVMIADELALYANPVFQAAAAGETPGFYLAWQGALAYTFQLYFDFSGYSDMAIGAARMFGIRLPFNFNSPYKADSIIDFWRRWHMTLSRFLRDYVYIPLGGNRKGKGRRHLNLMVTMLLGGLWHGAGWTFVLWGGLHGLYLVINHVWHVLCRLFGVEPGNLWPYRLLSRLLTFFAVVVAWVFFRATDMDSALVLVSAMFDFGSAGIPDKGEQRVLLASLLLLLWVWYSPNSQQFTGQSEDEYRHRRRFYLWRPGLAWGGIIAFLGIVTLLNLSKFSEFLYFQF